MAWSRGDDAGQYRTAHELQRFYGTAWLILWGPASRAYWAFRCGAADSLRLSAPTPEALVTAIERAARAPDRLPTHADHRYPAVPPARTDPRHGRL